MTAVDPSVSVETTEAPPPTVRDVVLAYVGLTKPRIIELLLLTTVPVMFLAQRGVPNLWLVVWTVVGGTLSAGSANALNCYYDRDIDERMRRTRRRALPRHIVSPRNALVFGLVLGIVSTLMLGLLVNWLSSGLALAANVFYVVGYTMILKRRTTQNIVWGGAAGCFPALIGWTAVTGSLAWEPVVLFLVVFFWTPPHFWSLSLLMKDEYARAGVPMLPVVHGEAETRRQILLYAVLLYAVTQLPFCAGAFGLTYLLASVALGATFIAGAIVLYRRADRRSALRLYLFSLAYLALLFCAMALDRVL